MKRLRTIFLCTCLVVCLSIIFARVLHSLSSPPQQRESPAGESSPPSLTTADAVNDSELVFTVLEAGEVVERSMAEYLPGVLAGEMPASFEPEALKAQAVAARTYIMYCMTGTSHRHPEADVCNDAGCCKAYVGEDELRELWGENYEGYSQKILAAVVETDGMFLSYAGAPIQAVFHSSSSGRTEDGGTLWSSLPYLVSVTSPETEQDVPNFISTVEVTAEELVRTISSVYPDAALDGDPETWVGLRTDGESGRVATLEIGGVAISGAELRSMFALRSTAFSLEFADGYFVFTVRGYGHGVGLSQYGANVMAKAGSEYREILEHYYPGADFS